MTIDELICRICNKPNCKYIKQTKKFLKCLKKYEAKRDLAELLESAKPFVFAGIFSANTSGYDELRTALEKFNPTDASLIGYITGIDVYHENIRKILGV
jgi:hypothetical protein